MIRLLFTLVVVVPGIGFANEDKPLGSAITEVKIEKLDVKPGKWNEPVKVSSDDELKKLVSDEKTREAIAKQVDLKTHDLLVFAWQGSGGDKLSYTILESFPEQVPFKLMPGVTDDLRTHTKLFAVRKNVRWSVK